MEKNVLELAVESLLSKLDSTEKFALEQCPEICRQMIAEEKVIRTMDAIMASTILLISTIVAPISIVYSDSRSIGLPLLAVVSCCGIFMSFCIGYGSIQNLLRLKVAPKKFLLTEFSRLIK